MRRLLLFLLVLFSACGSSGGKTLRIGVDLTWRPIDFEELQPYVNGYIEELLLEIARYNGMEFEKVSANWDTLFEGLRDGKYDAVLSSMPPYVFNAAKFDFSENILDLGPVLITSSDASYKNLSSLSGEFVGILNNSSAALLIEKYPKIIIRNYPSIPDVLNAIVQGELEAAVLDRLPAVSFVRDLYAGKLKIASEPLTDVGLHLVAPKGKAVGFMQSFNTALSNFKKKKKLEAIQQKWNLQE
ncbi:MAG: amino acid ABC transporter substrate-binding protein [Verrucomicrobiota bacterium]|nr:amino acid ABC transporter substrate-binding protein [Verrucomicrobiota bacterium]